jgi:hypothetical protein
LIESKQLYPPRRVHWRKRKGRTETPRDHLLLLQDKTPRQRKEGKRSGAIPVVFIIVVFIIQTPQNRHGRSHLQPGANLKTDLAKKEKNTKTIQVTTYWIGREGRGRIENQTKLDGFAQQIVPISFSFLFMKPYMCLMHMFPLPYSLSLSPSSIQRPCKISISMPMC